MIRRLCQLSPRVRPARRGFTLIEMLTVAVIIGILATVSLAYLREARIQANEAAALGALNQFQNAYEQYWITNGKSYPQFLTNGTTDGDKFRYRNQQEVFADLVRQGLLPSRYSGQPLDRDSLITPGYRLVIFPYDRPGVDTAHEDPSQVYAIALQPVQGGDQRNTVAILNGDSFGRTNTARFYKLPNRGLDLGTASIYAMVDQR